jgi:hypothetical protein
MNNTTFQTTDDGLKSNKSPSSGSVEVPLVPFAVDIFETNNDIFRNNIIFMTWS